MLTLGKIAKELRQYHNHICILYDMQLVRLIGVREDEEDFYYIVQEMGRGKHYASYVGDLYSLKGLLPEEKYETMDQLFEMNNCLKEDEFLILTKSS